MDDELEVIRNQMEETRASIADKLDTLETQFRDTFQGATKAVTDTVDSVKSTVDSVRETLDITSYVDAHPWMMLGGAMVAGCLTSYVTSGSDEPPTNGSYASNGNGTHERASYFAGESGFQSNVDTLRGMAIGALMGVVREMALRSAPQQLVPGLTNLVDNLTTRMGGKPIRRNA